MRIAILLFLVCASAFARQYATGYVPHPELMTAIPWERVDAPQPLPAAFDWRAKAQISPIKDQGSCGSCWAFGTTAVVENDLRIFGKATDILSEQEIVSCDRQFDGCMGGDFAFDYVVSPGQSLASEFPYVGHARCKRNLSHKWRIASWSYVGDQNSTPTVDEIKAALYQYGLVAVTVAADGAFMNYRSGVFDGNSGDINHIVALVGWDDATQSWILRNSWGTSWGEQGYMRIRYGANSVAQQAAFAKLTTF